MMQMDMLRRMTRPFRMQSRLGCQQPHVKIRQPRYANSRNETDNSVRGGIVNVFINRTRKIRKKKVAKRKTLTASLEPSSAKGKMLSTNESKTDHW